MSKASVQVIRNPDPAADGGGIIRIVGAMPIPLDAIFRIEPVDDAPGAAPEPGWPIGDLVPRSIRTSSTATEFLVGADIVDAPALQPGTPVAICVPAAALRSEIRWPTLPVAKPVSRRAVVMTSKEHAAELAAQQAKATAALPQIAAAPSERTPADRTEDMALARLMPPGNPATNGHAGLDWAQRLDVAMGTPTMAAADGTIASRPKLATVENPDLAPSSARAAVPSVVEMPSPVKRRASVLGDAGQGSALPSTGAPVVVRRRTDWASTAMAFAVGFLIAGGVAAGIWIGFERRARPTAVQSVAGGGAEAVPSAPAASAAELAPILNIPDRSPLGFVADDIDLTEALKRADEYLASDRPDARQEAKYWLRRALVIGLGDERLSWTMAQLGTLYASGEGGPPDYAAARLLWELSAGKGDPVSMCFLGSLYEHGLGVAKDRTRALAQFERARQRGGCPNVEQSINRLKKASP